MNWGPKHKVNISVGFNQHYFIGSITVTDAPHGIQHPVAMVFLPKITVAIIMSSPFT